MVKLTCFTKILSAKQNQWFELQGLKWIYEIDLLTGGQEITLAILVTFPPVILSV